MERLLRTSPHHLFGRWLQDAEAAAEGAAERAQWSLDARRLVTLWGYPISVPPRHTSKLSEYAYRLWAGLVGSYYRARWGMFTAAVRAAAAGGVPFNQSAHS